MDSTQAEQVRGVWRVASLTESHLQPWDVVLRALEYERLEQWHGMQKGDEAAFDLASSSHEVHCDY